MRGVRGPIRPGSDGEDRSDRWCSRRSRCIGGNTSTVVRVGDTVRRNAGPWTPAVHALLRHLERVGFTGSPRALGMDERGREVLSYLEGECGEYPLAPHWVTDEALVAVGHDAAAVPRRAVRVPARRRARSGARSARRRRAPR